MPAHLAGLAAGSRAFYAARGERRGPASLAELRALQAANEHAAVPAGVTVERVTGPAGREATLYVRPPRTGPVRGVFLSIPGGGFHLGPTAGEHARNGVLADTLGLVVVGVGHRLAPDHPWPAAPDDCETAARWVLDATVTRFGTTTLAIGGSSAGATLAVTTLLRLRDTGHADAVRAAVLQFGTYDLSGQTPAGRLIAGEYFLEAYLAPGTDRTAPDVSPVFGDLRGLPPTLVLVGARDVLLADNLAMAQRLSDAGVEVDLRVYPESPHGFTGHPTAMARAALADRDAWLAERLAAG
ncbi:alpha/beta hydrolase fold domain-containing protein [Blastococcus sp. SYSU D00695]